MDAGEIEFYHQQVRAGALQRSPEQGFRGGQVAGFGVQLAEQVEQRGVARLFGQQGLRSVDRCRVVAGQSLRLERLQAFPVGAVQQRREGQ